MAIVDSAKSLASPKHDPNTVPDQRVSAITPATVRFLKGFSSLLSDQGFVDFFQI